VGRVPEALEDAGLLSKEKLLAGDVMPDFAAGQEDVGGETSE